MGQPVSLPSVHGLEAQQGEALLLTVKIDRPAARVWGRFQERTIPFFKIGPKGQYGGLVGIDLAAESNLIDMRIEIQGPDGQGSNGNGIATLHRLIQVKSSGFRVEELTVPPKRDALDEGTLRRVKEERELMIKKLSGVSRKRLWDGPFLVPVSGPVSGNFGSKRIINGQPRNPHSGEDIAAPGGTPVAASNHGLIVWTGDFFFSGKGVLLDHGLGLFTMYFHLSKIMVKEGETVSKGQTIGQVGATGRATGPHLHWGARLNMARINPFSLTRLPLQKSP